jgi:hypothetical protein
MSRVVFADQNTVGRDLGSGTAFPASGPSGTTLHRGDAYYHTGLACLMVYNGSSWRQAHVSAVADGAARGAISTSYSGALHPGFRVRQADTGATWEWAGTAWAAQLGTPMAGQYNGSATGSANQTTYNAPTLTPSFEQGGLSLGTITGGALTLPNGMWMVDYALSLNASGTMSGRSFVVFGGQRHPLGMIGEDFSGTTWLFPVRGASAAVTISYYVQSTVTPYASNHVLTLARIGAAV